MKSLTGRTRYRTTWRGRLVLQVEYRWPSESPGEWHKGWRDAKVVDLVDLKVPS